MKLYIKFMICQNCIIKIKVVLEELGLKYVSVEKGVIELVDQLNDAQLKLLSTKLKNIGYEVYIDRDKAIVEAIKYYISEEIYHSNCTLKPNIRLLLTSKFSHTYKTLSIIFKKHCKITISTFYNDLKLEKIKEMLSYHDNTRSMIADSTHFGSVQALCKFFKKKEGCNTTEFDKKKNSVIKINKKKK